MKKLSFYIAGFFAIAALVITSCAAPVHVEKDPQTDFSKYKTYAWIDENNGKKGKANDLEEKSVHEAVSKELANSSWKEVTTNPDVLISYDVLVEKSVRRESNPVYTQSASRLYFNPYTRRYGTIFYPSRFLGYDNYNVPVKEGTLTITVTDANTDKTIWQGWTTDEVNSRRMSRKELSDKVRAIFKKFDITKK